MTLNSLSKFIIKYLADKKLLLIDIIAMITVFALEGSITPYLLGKMVNIVESESNNKERLLHVIIIPAVLYVLMQLFTNFSCRLTEYFSLKLYPAIKAEITSDMFEYLLGHSYDFFQSNFSGTLTKKIFDMSNGVEKMLKITTTWIYSSGMGITIAIITLYFVVHPIFSVILLVWAICFVGISFLTAESTQEHAKNLSKANTKLSGTLSDSTSNIISTKLFSKSKHELERVKKDISNVVKSEKELQWQTMKVFFLQGCAVTLLIGSMVTALVYGYMSGWITAGDFALVLSLSTSCLMMIFGLGQQILKLFRTIGICQESLSFVKVHHKIVDTPNAIPLKVTKGTIEFNDVVFSYNEDKLLFNNLNMKIASGEKIGLIGYSGGGKSTFISLLLRLIEPQSGQVIIDNQDISQVQYESLREQIATIPQDTTLFHRGILDNIKFAKSSASDDDIIAAAKRAKCHDFIMELPEQYDTLVGERGVKLSGGQRQRISIARAFLKDAPILVLDEATSALDTITEKLIHESLDDVIRGRTALVIAHRLSTLQSMDKIIVFDNGNIVEQGSPSILLNDHKSHFYKLWKMQSDGFIQAKKP